MNLPTYNNSHSSTKNPSTWDNKWSIKEELLPGWSKCYILTVFAGFHFACLRNVYVYRSQDSTFFSSLAGTGIKWDWESSGIISYLINFHLNLNIYRSSKKWSMLPGQSSKHWDALKQGHLRNYKCICVWCPFMVVPFDLIGYSCVEINSTYHTEGR